MDCSLCLATLQFMTFVIADLGSTQTEVSVLSKSAYELGPMCKVSNKQLFLPVQVHVASV